jgi:phosphoglycolate phosphatase-like HAD superfamily hydrolase
MTGGAAVAIDLDGALVDTRPLWDDWLGSAAGVLGLDPTSLPGDRGAAARVLDDTAGNWRTLLERYCEERVAVHVRRDPATSEALRSLAASGWEIDVFTDAPEPLARLALAQIGADRRVSTLEAGTGALERLRDGRTSEPVVVSSRAELLSLAASLE